MTHWRRATPRLHPTFAAFWAGFLIATGIGLLMAMVAAAWQ